MKRISVKALNECFNVNWSEFLWISDDYEQPLCNQPWNKGKVGLYEHSLETKKLITGRKPGTPATEEWRKNKSKSMKGEDNHFFGKTHTQKTKQKIIQRHYKLWKFVSPDGKLIEDYTTLRQFCKKYNLDRKSLFNVIRGKTKQHRGWTLPKLSTTP